MSYFSMFPELQYDAKGNGVVNLQKDIFRRVKVKATSKSNIVNFDYYNVQDGETPEMIAHKYYGDVNLHWTILVANDIVDYYEDWPMSVQKFEQFMFDKYDNPQGIHHYEITQTSGDTTVTVDVGTEKDLVLEDYPTATEISNYQYEDRLQEQKRQIRLISPDFISQFVSEFEKKLSEKY